jgi:hypothetical protein
MKTLPQIQWSECIERCAVEPRPWTRSARETSMFSLRSQRYVWKPAGDARESTPAPSTTWPPRAEVIESEQATRVAMETLVDPESAA